MPVTGSTSCRLWAPEAPHEKVCCMPLDSVIRGKDVLSGLPASASRAGKALRTGFDPRPTALAPLATDDAGEASLAASVPASPAGSPSVSFIGAPSRLSAPLPGDDEPSGRSTSTTEAIERSRRASEAGVQPWRLACVGKLRQIARVACALVGHACASALYAVTWMASEHTRDVYEASLHNVRRAWAEPDADPAPPAAPSPRLEPAGADAGDRGQASVLITRMRQAQAQYKKAVAQVQVDFARKAFFMKCVDVALGVAALSVAVAATVLSGGAALAIPGLIVSGVMLYWAVTDWKCARENLQAAREGRPQLPMGSNALANTLHRYYTDVRGLPPHEARWRSAVTASVTSCQVAGASLAMGLAIRLPLRVAASVTRVVISGLYRVCSGIELGLSRRQAAVQQAQGQAPLAPGLATGSAADPTLDDHLLANLLELLKVPGLIGEYEPDAPSIASPTGSAWSSVDLDDDEDDAGADAAVPASDDDDWLEDDAGVPPAPSAPAPVDGAAALLPGVIAGAVAARPLSADEARRLVQWARETSDFQRIEALRREPAPGRRRQLFEALLAELAHAERRTQCLTLLGYGRFIAVNGLYGVSLVRGITALATA